MIDSDWSAVVDSDWSAVIDSDWSAVIDSDWSVVIDSRHARLHTGMWARLCSLRYSDSDMRRAKSDTDRTTRI